MLAAASTAAQQAQRTLQRSIAFLRSPAFQQRYPSLISLSKRVPIRFFSNGGSGQGKGFSVLLQEASSSQQEKQQDKQQEKKDNADAKADANTETPSDTDKKSSNNDDNENKPNPLMGWLVLGGLALAFAFLSSGASQALVSQGKEITFKEMVDRHLKTGQIDHLEYDMNSNVVYVYLRKGDGAQGAPQQPSQQPAGAAAAADGQQMPPMTKVQGSQSSSKSYDFYVKALSVENFEQKLQDMEERLDIPASASTNVVYRDELNLSSVLVSLLETAAFIGILVWLNRRTLGKSMDMFGMGKVNVRTDHKVKVSFKDVAGMDEAKLEITEFVDFLKKPEKYKKLGAKIPRGAILMGPPGTGKTLLAKAVAGEAGVPFFSMSGSDFVEMFVGVGPARVRDLFAQARKHEKAIIYIDEIDAIGRPRGNNSSFGGGNDERENTLNQLLVEMDGFSERENVIVMASTNVDKDGLDAALMRPGRFDRQITIDRPDHKERLMIFQVHLKPLKVQEEVLQRVDRLAELTPGMTGADIANVCNEAAIYAARASRDAVAMEDVERAIERVVGGLEKKTTPITPEEKKVIAYHEAGHAVVAWFCKFCDPLLKLSIIPRGKALGYAQYIPRENFIRTKDQLMDMIAQALGGRAAEQLIFGHQSTGAQDDLQKITRIAYAAVSSFGMSSAVGPLSFPIPGDPSIAMQKPYGEETAQIMDHEVREIIDDAYARAQAILKEKEPLLQQVAQYLIRNEKMSIDEFREMAGARPFASDEKGIMPADVIVVPPSAKNHKKEAKPEVDTEKKE